MVNIYKSVKTISIKHYNNSSDLVTLSWSDLVTLSSSDLVTISWSDVSEKQKKCTSLLYSLCVIFITKQVFFICLVLILCLSIILIIPERCKVHLLIPAPFSIFKGQEYSSKQNELQRLATDGLKKYSLPVWEL